MAIENDGLQCRPFYRVIHCGGEWKPSVVFSSLLLLLLLQCCSASTETERTIRDGEPRTATSTFTQLLNSDSGFLRCSPFSL